MAGVWSQYYYSDCCEIAFYAELISIVETSETLHNLSVQLQYHFAVEHKRSESVLIKRVV